MTTSPDYFHSVRVSRTSQRAANINLQVAEYNAHKAQVDEYKDDMYMHLLQRDIHMRPSLCLMQQQPEINLRMRPLLLDFLMDVINKLNLSKATFPLTVNLVDRYCLVRIVKKQHYQLLGLTALWIACKNSDAKMRVPTLNDLCKYCCNCYDKKLFLEMESHVLKLLGWHVAAPTFDSFVDMAIHTLAQSPFLAGSRNPHQVCNDVKVVAIYICELVQFYPNIYFHYAAPNLALVSVTAACLIRGVPLFDAHDFLGEVAVATGVNLVTTADFYLALALLVKVLKCPPPSLKTKYFQDGLRFLRLMKLVIQYTRTQDRAASMSLTASSSVSTHGSPSQRTPLHLSGEATPKYPATPVLLSISPKEPHYNHHQRTEYKTLPLPSLLPGSEAPFGTKRAYLACDAPAKRPKLDKAVFYIQ